MGTISEKLAYLNETKNQIKNELNDLGAEITSNDTFRSYSQKIQDLYDDMPKITTTGTNFSISPTKKGKIQLTLKGNTEQTSYTGKNKLTNTVNSATLNGIDYTINPDRSVTINGTASSQSNFYFVGTSSQYVDIGLAPGNYTLSGCESGSSNKYVLYCVIKHTDGTTTSYPCYNGAKLVSVSEGDTFRLFIRVISGVTVEKEVVYPQLESGTTATSYEPYVGGVSAPNPDYPQRVRVVTGNNTIGVTGKNLCKVNHASDEVSGVTFTVNTDGSVTASGTSTKEINFYLTTSPHVVIDKTKNYVLSGSPSTASSSTYRIMGTVFKDDGTTSYIADNTGNGVTIPTTDTTSVRVYINIKNGVSIDTTFYPMVEVGTIKTSYEPYSNTEYPINLGSLKMCQIDDVQDYFYKENGNWYKYPAISKVVFTGENESWSSATIGNYIRFLSPLISDSNTETSRTMMFSNYFNFSTGNKVGCGFIYARRFYAYPNQDITTTEAFKAWLATHNTEVYYPSTNPVVIQITDETLIAQLEAISNAMSESGATNISQTNADLPFFITATCLTQAPTGSINITQSGNTDVTDYATAVLTTEQKTVKSTTSSQTVTPSAGKFIDEITVSPIDLETKYVTPSTSVQVITPSSNKDGIAEINVSAVDNTIDRKYPTTVTLNLESLFLG